MTNFTVLAHRIDGKQALVQHDVERDRAYLYDLYEGQGSIDYTYVAVDTEYTVKANEWVTDFKDGAPRFENANTMRAWLQESAEVYA